MILDWKVKLWKTLLNGQGLKRKTIQELKLDNEIDSEDEFRNMIHNRIGFIVVKKLVKVIVNQSGQANHSHLCRWSDKHRFLFLSLTQQWIRNRCFQRKHQEFFSVHRTAEAFEKCVEMYICFNVAAFSSFSHTLRLFLPFDGYLPKTLGAAAAADVEAWPCTTM